MDIIFKINLEYGLNHFQRSAFLREYFNEQYSFSWDWYLQYKFTNKKMAI